MLPIDATVRARCPAAMSGDFDRNGRATAHLVMCRVRAES